MQPLDRYFDIFFTLVGTIPKSAFVIFFITLFPAESWATDRLVTVLNNPPAAKSPAKVNAKYFPLDTNGLNLTSSANCQLILGDGSTLFGARLRGDYSIRQDGNGTLLNIKTGEQLKLDQHFQKFGYVMGFDPQAEWVLLQQPSGSAHQFFYNIIKFNLKTLEKDYLMAGQRISYRMAGEALSKSGQFVLIAESYGENQLVLHLWDLLRDSQAKSYVVNAPTADNDHARGLLISENGKTFAALGAVKKVRDHFGASTRVWRMTKASDNLLNFDLPGIPKYLSPDGNMVLTKEFHGGFRLFRFHKRSFVEIKLEGQIKIFDALGLRNEHLQSRTSEHIRFISAQLDWRGKLAIEFSYEVDNGQLDQGEGWTQHSFSRHHGMLVFDIVAPAKKPLLIDEAFEKRFNKQAYRVLPNGRLYLVGANILEVMFIDPVSKQELHLPLQDLLSDQDEFIWRIEFSDDLTKVALSTNAGVLVLDLSNLAK